ncbi:MAG: FAD-linked oxidase C-terminal domain-containing protein, partial [Desulfobacterales bacterium]
KVTPAMQSIEASIHAALQAHNQSGHVFSHLSHVYPSGSSIYTTFIFRLSESPAHTLETWQGVKHAASRAVVAAGGTISHQHGVGRDHREYLPFEKGHLGINVLREIFNHIDPDQRMNPDKLLPRTDDT